MTETDKEQGGEQIKSLKAALTLCELTDSVRQSRNRNRASSLKGYSGVNLMYGLTDRDME